MDVAEAMLAIDAMKQFGAIEGGPAANLVRCRELLDLGRARGIAPRADAVEAVFAAWNPGVDAGPESAAAR